MKKIVLFFYLIICISCSPVLLKFKHQDDEMRRMTLVLYKDSTGYLENKYLSGGIKKYRQNFNFRPISDTTILVVGDTTNANSFKKFDVSYINPFRINSDPSKVPILNQDTITFDKTLLFFYKKDNLDYSKKYFYLFIRGPNCKIYNKYRQMYSEINI